jgi:F-type H+-transporting ATPase subunit delta
MADNNTVARPYARAIFEVARELDALQSVAASLDAAKELLRDGQIVRFLANPSLHDAGRLEFLQGLFAKAAGKDSLFAGTSEQGTNVLKLLLEYDRIDALPQIAEHFEALKAQIENTVDVVVTSAAPLSDAQQKTVATALKERLGRDVRLATKIDENLIGGAVIRAGDVVIDGSVRARLEGLANALTA